MNYDQATTSFEAWWKEEIESKMHRFFRWWLRKGSNKDFAKAGFVGGVITQMNDEVARRATDLEKALSEKEGS